MVRATSTEVALAELDATPNVSMFSEVHPVARPSVNVVVFSTVRDAVNEITLTVVVLRPVARSLLTLVHVKDAARE